MYAPALVLLAWSALWTLGLCGDLVIAAALAALLYSLIKHAKAVIQSS